MAVQDVVNGEPSQGPGAMYLAKCVLKSSVVLHAVRGHIRSSTTEDLVFGKETALELLVLVEDGSVQSVCEQLVFGTIKDMKVLHWNAQNQLFRSQAYGKDILVLLSDSGNLSFLTFNTGLHRFLAVKHIHLSPPGNFLNELGWSLAIESRGHAIAVAAFQDRVAIFPSTSILERRMDDMAVFYPEEQQKRITAGKNALGWGTIWSMTFISTSHAANFSIESGTDLSLAVLLSRKDSNGNEVQILVCNSRERRIQLKACYNPSGIYSLCPMSFQILHIPAVPGFLLLLRPGDIVLIDVRTLSNPETSSVISLSTHMEDEGVPYSFFEEGTPLGDEDKNFSAAASALVELYTRAREGTRRVRNITEGRSDVSNELEASGICTTVPFVYSWSWEPESLGCTPRLVLGLNTGEICFISFFPGGSEKLKISMSDSLYKCSPCNSLLWTNGGFITAIVEMGDGQVLRLVDGKLIQQNVIQKLAPIIDFSLGDYYGEKQDQMFSACGLGDEGSIRVVRNGVSVEKLFTTPAVYPGVTGTWTMHLHHADQYHAFLVISFVEETRVLSVGLNFVDITEAVGFCPSANTLACGLLEDGWVTQVCCAEVNVCAPTAAAHPAGIECAVPILSSWKPQDYTISLGAVSCQKVILSMSRPGLLVMLSSIMTMSGTVELVETQRCLLDAEVSCISIPLEVEQVHTPLPPTIRGLLEGGKVSMFPDGVEVGKVCVVGTHKPSVELLSIVAGEMFSSVAVGIVSLVNSVGAAMSGCVPQDVRLVLFDRLYILTGLRNGMLLRYEWPDNGPTSLVQDDLPLICSRMHGKNLSRVPDKVGNRGTGLAERTTQLHLVAVRRIGVSPVSLVPLQASLRADIIALSDRPWLLQTARHSQRIAYTSISFQPSTHVTPVSSFESPKGILFVSDNCLHLVEMEHSKRLNVQKLPLKSPPRRILYHSETKTLLVLRTEIIQGSCISVSSIACVDPLSGLTHSCYKFETGEVAKSMQLWNTGNDKVLLVGTALGGGRMLMPSGEAESAKGRVIVFHLEPKHTGRDTKTSTSYTSCSASSSSSYGSSIHCSEQNVSDFPDEDSNAEGESWDIIFKTSLALPGVVLAVTPYMAQYILASAGNSLFCLGFLSDSTKRLRKLAAIKSRFLITSVTTHLTRIAVGDCRDGVLIYTYREDSRKFEQLYCDPMQRLIADCALVDFETPMATDRHGNFCVLSCPGFSEEGASPERNLKISCWYHIGEISMSIRKGSFAYKVPVEESMKACSRTNNILSDTADYSVVVSTVLGSVFVFIRLTREEYELLEAVQTRLSRSSLAAPLLGNDHARFRGQGCPVGVKKVLDGDMLSQFLELTSAQQQEVLNGQADYASEALGQSSSGLVPALLCNRFSIEGVLRLLERLHNSLT